VVSKQAPFERSVDNFLKIIFDKLDVNDKIRDELERMVLYYNRRGLQENPNFLEWLLGRVDMKYQEAQDRV